MSACMLMPGPAGARMGWMSDAGRFNGGILLGLGGLAIASLRMRVTWHAWLKEKVHGTFNVLLNCTMCVT